MVFFPAFSLSENTLSDIFTDISSAASSITVIIRGLLMKDLFSIHIYTAVIRLRLDHMPGGLFLVWRD